MNQYVYAIDNEHGDPCYIGMGRNNRLLDHFKNKTSSSRDLSAYITDCQQRGIALNAYKVAEELSTSQALNYERTLIAWYGRRDNGTGQLYNLNSGGSGGGGKHKPHIFSPEGLEAQRKAHIGKALHTTPHTAESRAKMSASRKAAWTDEQRTLFAERARLTHTGRRQSAEHIANRVASRLRNARMRKEP